MDPIPTFFELRWGILCGVGLLNILIGSLVISIAQLTVLTSVPVILSVFCALGNGLGYYVFDNTKSLDARVVAAIVADVFVTLQEIGLTIYGYVLLAQLIRERRKRIILHTGYWILIVISAGSRVPMVVHHIEWLRSSQSLVGQSRDNWFIGYFGGLAFAQGWIAFFLLRVYFKACQNESNEPVYRVGIVKKLARSSEVRIASLCLVGLTRIFTSAFRHSNPSTINLAEQLDRFVYAIECLFPIVFMIDFLASRLSSATGFSNGYYEYPTDRLDDTLKLQEVNIPTKPATGAGSTIPPPAPAAVDVLRTDTFDVEYTPRKDSRTPTQ